MFETSLVLAQTRPVRRRAGLLTASLIAHTAAIIGAVALSVASTDFPEAAPMETVMFMAAEPPPPLGNPNGGAPEKPAITPPEQKPATPPPAPAQITAPPTDIPENVTPVDTPSTGDSTATGEGDGRVPGRIGVPWGDEHSISTNLDAPPAPIRPQPVEEKVYTVGGEIKAPVLLHKVDPGYPEIMRRTRMRATVGIRCIIDKNGRVRDPQVVLPAMGAFNDAVINAVKQWRYQPGSLRGQAVETYLDVTVTFSLN